LNPLTPLFSWRRRDADAQKLYGSIVAQARLPVFYQVLGVPDTLEGRFVVLSLSLFGVLNRLKTYGAEARALSQQLMNEFSADMETVLRELGVGDLTMPKKVRKLAASSAALLQSYEKAFAEGEGALASTITAALPLDGLSSEAAGERLAHYVTGVIQRLGYQSLSAIRAGNVEFLEFPVRDTDRTQVES
jgi:cytochrome b pre-mRNA-processing protein 3